MADWRRVGRDCASMVLAGVFWIGTAAGYLARHLERAARHYALSGIGFQIFSFVSEPLHMINSNNGAQRESMSERCPDNETNSEDHIMKAIITTVALTSALIAGTAAAGTVSVDQSQFGNGIGFSTASHYDSVEKVTIDGANLGSNVGETGLYIGSK